jgi:hypothetical protein
MKKLLFAILVLLAVTSCANSGDKKYEIIDSRGNSYYTDSYQQEGNCITFFANCGCGDGTEKGYVLCGSFSIENTK